MKPALIIHIEMAKLTHFGVFILFLGLSFPVKSLAFECEEWGIFPDPENCQNFYECSPSGQDLFSCPDGYLFNDELLVCDYENQVDCGDRPRPGNTTNPPSNLTTFLAGNTFKKDFLSKITRQHMWTITILTRLILKQ